MAWPDIGTGQMPAGFGIIQAGQCQLQSRRLGADGF